jgi:hypothetical protein
MYPIIVLSGMVVFTWAVTIWATWQDSEQRDFYSDHTVSRLHKAA